MGHDAQGRNLMGNGMRWRGALAAAVLTLLAVPAAAERRVALVVGNSQYVHIPTLSNPGNDARLMAETLRGLGFALVGGGPQLDLDKPRLDTAVQAFGQALAGADVALFYYAGHGVQVRGNNYLVPVAANPAREADVDFQMVDVGLVLRQMEGAGTRLNLILLDACRNNPFGGRGLRSAQSGLAQMRAPEGTLISYATQPGNVALDGSDGNSPYTTALTQAIRRPGVDIFQTFNQVGLSVMQATGNAQQPWLSTSPIRGAFYFAGAGDGSTPAPPPVVAPIRVPEVTPPPAPPAPPARASRSWRVHDTVSDGILNMRAGPGVNSRVVVAIPAGSAGLVIGACQPSRDNTRHPWCEAEWRGQRGYVSSCCIEEVATPGRRTFRVLPDVSEGILNLRRGPGSRHPLVASMPAGAANLLVGRCRMPDDGGRTPWCEVEWQGRSGWASACCMVDVRTGAFARVGD
jgi:uncharacterized protein YraI